MSVPVTSLSLGQFSLVSLSIPWAYKAWAASTFTTYYDVTISMTSRRLPAWRQLLPLPLLVGVTFVAAEHLQMPGAGVEGHALLQLSVKHGLRRL